MNIMQWIGYRLRSANEDNTQFEMSQMSQVQLQFSVSKLVWNIHNNSNSTDFSQPLHENKWIKSNNSYLWMCITEYSPPRHDIIVLQRTKLCPNHVRSQYTSTHTPPTTHWQGHTPLQSHCGQWPAALTWPFAQPRLRSVNGGAVFTFFYGFNFYVYFSIRMCCLSCFRKAMMCQKSET